MLQSLADLERFLHEERSLPVLIHCGLAHAQFETIHPFLDGNGRIGRLLITFSLYQRGVLHHPVLYLSTFLKRNRSEYYDRLMTVREQGDREGWLRFFLRGVADVAEEATETARAIIRLREAHRNLIQAHGSGLHGLRLLELLFHFPVVNVRLVEQRLDVAFVTANKLLMRLEALGLVEETTGGKKFRRFRYTPYLLLFDKPNADSDHQVPIQTTEAEQ